jgi:hypothetical protein
LPVVEFDGINEMLGFFESNSAIAIDAYNFFISI